MSCRGGLGVEGAAGDEGHPLAQGVGEEVVGAHARGELGPDEEPAVGPRPARALRGGGAPARRAWPRSARRRPRAAWRGGRRSRSVARSCAAARWASVAVCRSAACLAMVQARTSSFGPTSQPSRMPGASVLENVPRWMTTPPSSSAASGGRSLAAEAQLAVGVVLEHGHAVLLAEADEGGAARAGERGALGVVELASPRRRACGTRTAKARREVVDVHAVVVAGHGDEGGLAAGEGLERGQVAGVLDGDRVARVEQHAGREVDALLRAVGDEHLVGADADAAAGEAGGDPLAQRAEALGGAVLERGAPVSRQHLGVRLGDGLDGEELGRGQPAGEREHLRLLGDLEDLAHGRGRHAPHAAREAERRAASASRRRGRDHRSLSSAAGAA